MHSTRSRCTPPFKSTRALGNGSSQCGGAASTAEGHHLAFGNTEEDLLVKILGCKQVGLPDDPPFRHQTGEGYVAARDGCYADALSKGNTVVPLICETLGGVNRDAYHTLYRLHGLATTEGHRDGTVYGTARTATRSFHAHHLRLISLAINVATAELISAGASVLAGRLFSPDAA